MRSMSPWALPSLLASGLLAYLLLYVHLRRPPAALWPSLRGLLWGALLFAAGDAVSGFVARDPLHHWLAIAALYTGALLLAPSAWFLALRSSELQGAPVSWGRSRLALAPVFWAGAMWLAVVSNPWHELFVTARVATRSDFNVLWYVNAVELHAVIAASALLFLRIARRSPSESARAQALVLAVALLIPAAGNLAYILPEAPPPFDPTSLGLLATAVVFIAGIYRRRLFALAPLDFAELLRQESDGVLLLDGGRRLLHRNPASDRWLGDRAPAPGDPALPALAERLAPTDRSAEALRPERLASELEAEPQPSGGRLYRVAGGEGFVRIEATPIRSAGGKLLCRSIRLRDETALHRALEASAEQASTLEGVLAATDEGVLVHAGGTIRFVNPQFHEIWQTPPEGLSLGETERLVQLYLPKVADREQFLAAVDRVRRDPHATVRDEIAMRDGRVLERTSLPLMRDGAAAGRVWRVRDVTEQRRSEEAIRYAQKLESLGVMAGGIAHDFNNLLVAVLGNAALARAELPAGSPALELLADIERAAEQASHLTRQLLAYAGKGKLEIAPLDVSLLAREVVGLLDVSIPKRIAIACDLADDLPAVTGDASQLRQVIMNLVLNAADAIGEDDGDVSISTHLADLGPEDAHGLTGEGEFRPGRYVALRVADTGCGMSEDVRARIFDPFFTTKFAGRGLGLAATLGIVRSHAGWLRVESEPGCGSAFTVLLPAGGSPAPAPGARPTPDAWRSRATALVVDDDEAVARVAERMLRSAGLRVLVARDGEVALALHRARRGEIDLVLLDLNMPRLSGEAVFRALRRDERSLKILLSSGYPEQEALARIAGGRDVAFVQKPYATEALLAKVRELLGE
jgi:signal transduction histidine kinase